MSNQIYKQDLHDIALAVANGSKAYTNKEVKKAKDELITFFSKNNVDFIDHTDEPTYRFTAPTNAKLLMLQSIGGNTVKLSPSVASDSTKAMIKTMPSVVYDFDVNKIKGASEVSENLNIEDYMFKTTLHNATYSNGVVTTSTLVNYSTFGFNVAYVSSQFELANKNEKTLFKAGTYYLSFDSRLTELNDNVCNLTPAGGNVILANTYADNTRNVITPTFVARQNINSTTFSRTILSFTLSESSYIGFLFQKGTSTNTSIVEMQRFMISTSNIDYEPYFDGIHNLELSGLKVEGANLADTSLFEVGAIDVSTGADNPRNDRMRSNYIEVTPSTTYTVKWGGADVNYFFYNENKVFISNAIGGTFTTTATTKYIRFYGGLDISRVMFNKGSTALPYEDYVSTTKTIDLTTIVDSNNNKLFPNGKLMGYNDLKDVLGVYNQESKWNEVDLGDLNYERNYSSTSEMYYFVAQLDEKALGKYNLLCAMYGLDDNGGGYSQLKNMNMVGRGSLQNQHNYIYIRNDSYTDATTFKTAMSGVKLQYERATYLTSNTDLSSTLRNIQGYSNGSIIAENTHNMDVESVITYNSIIQETLCPSVTVDGANLFDDNGVDSIQYVGNYYLNGATYNYTIVSNSNYNAFRISVKENTTYYIKEVSGLIIRFEDSSKNLISGRDDLYYAGYGSFTTPSGCAYIFFSKQKNSTLQTMLNYGSTALSYRPYKPSITRNLPTQASDGYSAGTQRNYRVFCDDEGNAVNKRYTNVDMEDLGNIDYIYSTSVFRGSLSTIKIISGTDIPNMLSKNYTTDTPNNVYNHVSDKTIASSTTTTQVWVNDTFYTDTTIFKNANTGNPLYYELADTSKTETDMDDFDYFFDVEEGDVITFNNAYAQQVYATYSFLIKEAKSNE